MDRYVTVDSPVGLLFVGFGDSGVAWVDFAVDAPGFEDAYQRDVGRPVAPADRAPAALDRALRRSLATGRLGSLPVDLARRSPFQQAVLREVARIPPGEVQAYGWVAAQIGQPGASRAVGSALARNPVPVLVPCHRVVAAGGRLGQYSWGPGPALKRQLLAHEGVAVDALA